MANPVVQIHQGQLKGQTENDFQGTPFLSFMGIPYAQAPTGELRFKSPQAPSTWDGIRDATKQGTPCHALQLLPTPEVCPNFTKHKSNLFFFKSLTLKPMGSEDCLFLNVYTRKVPNDLKPVMVFIHGGAFIAGSSDRAMYGPEFLMTEDIVLVTVNYRLVALGNFRRWSKNG